MDTFDEANGPFLVLINAQREYSLWPEHLETPGGWVIEFGPAAKNQCCQHIEQRWLSLQRKADMGRSV